MCPVRTDLEPELSDVKEDPLIRENSTPQNNRPVEREPASPVDHKGTIVGPGAAEDKYKYSKGED